MFYNYIALGIIFGISLAVGWEDIRYKKIRNNWIILGFALGFTLLATFYVIGLTKFDYIEKVALNTSISFLVGFAIWKGGFWPAGDSKLFTLLAFLLPLHYYWKSYLEYFPAFILLANTFFAFLIFMFFKIIFILSGKLWFFLREGNSLEKIKDIIREKIKKIAKIKIHSKNIIKFLSFFAFSILIYATINSFYFKQAFNPKSFLISMIVLGILRYLVKVYAKLYSQKSIAPADLKVRFNLADETIKSLKKNKETLKDIGKLRPEGLDERQVALIQKYFFDNKAEKMAIYKTVPFSLWLIIGAIITIAINTSLFQFLQSLF